MNNTIYYIFLGSIGGDDSAPLRRDGMWDKISLPSNIIHSNIQASAACSTDSAGSSLSMDDASENMMEESILSKYGHSLTPDEPVILEENDDDYLPWAANSQPKYSPNFKSCSPSQVCNTRMSRTFVYGDNLFYFIRFLQKITLL